MRYQRWGRAATLLVMLLLIAAGLNARDPRSYVYSYWEDAVPAPAAYLAIRTVEGTDLGTGRWSNPEDLFVSPDGTVYVTDTQNDRIIKTDINWDQVEVIDSFARAGAPAGVDTFNEPEGVYATDEALYIADTQNQRIVVLDHQNQLIRIIGAPESDVIREDYKYLPARLVVDRAERMYVVGPGMYEGIMEFDQDGQFSGFLGSNRVQFNFIDYIWKQISTDEQRAGMTLFIPEEFSNLDIDSQGFIYSTTQNEETEHPVKKHNAEGFDVLKREGFFDPVGDVDFNNIGSIRGPSSFVDVAVDQNGIYHTLDSKRGRIFTYDHDGNLLAVTGGPGNQLGLFENATSIELNNGSLLVLDQALGRITVFELTEYGRMLREALIRYGNGDYDTASVLWERVLAMNGNLELGYTGLGKIQLRRDRYEEALTNFRLGNSRQYFSKAFRFYRKAQLRTVAPFVLTGLVVLVTGFFVYRRYRPATATGPRYKYIGGSLPIWKRLQFSGYILKKPFDGFWDLRHERVGTVLSATLMLVLYAAVVILKRQASGFLFLTVDASDFNLFEELIQIVLPVGLFCLANWSLTSLMDGEGSMRDIFVSACYALAPVVYIFPIITILSHVLSLEEGAFYYFFETFAYVWVVFLIFVGNKSIHGYSVKKTVGMLLLTIVAAGVIIFLGVLFVTFIEQVWSFFYSVYREIFFRI